MPTRLAACLLAALLAAVNLPLTPAAADAEPDRSPVDLVLIPAGDRLLTVNQASHTVSLVRLADGKVAAEAAVGRRPTAAALTPDGRTLLVTGTYSGDVTFLAVEGDGLKPAGALRVGFEPRGVALSPDGRTAYVARTAAGDVAVIDVADRRVAGHIAVGRWPRYLAVSPDGTRLAVGVNGDGGVAVVDPAAGKKLFAEEFAGLNLGQMQISADNRHVYFPWIVYRQNPITIQNIKLGWVLASRVARVRLDKPARREALSLDPQGKAVGDPHGLALRPDGQQLAVAASGSQELLLMRVADLPLIDYGGTDHIDPTLLEDENRFARVELGGRPMAVRYSADGRRIFVANALLNRVQEVDPAARRVVRSIELGGPKGPSLARRGEAVFHDARRSLDQWYSCHSCHYEGHTNAVAMDTRNDGTFGTFKTVLSLRNVTRTGPWTWHGWQSNIDFAMRKSLTDSMLGPPPADEDVRALVAYLETLAPPPNPHRNPDGTLTEAGKRGEAVFRGEVAGCTRCHKGPFGTDGKVHDVGTGARRDAYPGFNTPSLVGAFDKVRYLHDGRAKSLEDALTGDHAPEKVTGNGRLSPDELRDLLAYLREL